MKKEDNMKRMIWIVVLLFFFTFLGTEGTAADRIVLKKYPGFKIGLLNVNFMNQWPLGVESAKKVIDFAAEKGFSWIELRDLNATLSLAQAKDLAAYAEKHGVEVGYATAVGLLDPSFWEVFSRALANAAVFEGPRTIRTSGAGPEFANDPKKTHWTFVELQKAVETANTAANMAKSFGLQHVVENAYEVIKGDGVSTFGAVELFGNTNSNFGLQFDTANFFCGISRKWTKPEEAQAFLEKYIKRMGYMHLKTSSPDHKPQKILGDNELSFETIFEITAKSNPSAYIAIELDRPATLEEVIANHAKSVEYLQQKFGK